MFFFPAGHYAVSWLLMGSLVIQIAAKASISRRAIQKPVAEPAPVARDRRRFLLAAAGASGTLVAVTIGQTLRPLRRLALLAPRRRDIAAQGFPVNKTVREAGVGSVQKGGRYRASVLEHDHVHDPDTLLAMQVDGEPLHPDHGYPTRLIACPQPPVPPRLRGRLGDDRVRRNPCARGCARRHLFALLVDVVSYEIVHDAIIAPLVVLVGWLLGRLLPTVARGPLRAAAATSALVIAFAYPLVRRWGPRPSNSSTLPLHRGSNLFIVLSLVWFSTAVVIVFRLRRRSET